MQFVFVSPDVTKFSDFQRKNADVNRTQEVRQVVYMLFEFSLGLWYNYAKVHYCRICLTDFREEHLFAPQL